MSDIEDILARLNPKTAQSFRLASEIESELLPTPSLGINMAIGGIGYGRFTTLYGNRGCGKTMFALQTVAEAQKMGHTAAWLDVERNFNPSWARRLGVDPSKMLVDNRTISIAAMADKGTEMIMAGARVLVIDSISQLLPQSYFEDAKDGKEELKGLAKSGQIGTFSKNIGQAINMLNSVNENCAIIMISQVRNNIGSYGASKSFMGGLALEHANSTTLKFWRTPSEIIEREIHVGDGLLLKRPVGAPVTWTVEKNRGPGMNSTSTYDIYTAGDSVGIDLASEVVTYGVEYGIIKKKGAWFTFPNDAQSQGAPKAATYLRENPDMLEKVYGEILAKSI